MTNEELQMLLKRNPSLSIGDTGTIAELERPARDRPLAAREAKASNSGAVHIRFVSVRKRLLDPDNISEKWVLDCLRFANIIRGDEPDKITLETTQRKAAKTEAEHTEVTIYELND